MRSGDATTRRPLGVDQLNEILGNKNCAGSCRSARSRRWSDIGSLNRIYVAVIGMNTDDSRRGTRMPHHLMFGSGGQAIDGLRLIARATPSNAKTRTLDLPSTLEGDRHGDAERRRRRHPGAVEQRQVRRTESAFEASGDMGDSNQAPDVCEHPRADDVQPRD